MKPIYPLLMLLAVLAGCAETSSVRRPALVEGPTTVRPETRPEVYISPGSLVPVTLRQSAPRRLFEERRANRVGDSLTVILNETTRASKDGGTKASRQGSNSADMNLRMNAQTGGTTTTNDIRLGLGSNGSTQFDSKGGATASNQFSGTITVTVIEVLSNGNIQYKVYANFADNDLPAGQSWVFLNAYSHATVSGTMNAVHRDFFVEDGEVGTWQAGSAVSSADRDFDSWVTRSHLSPYDGPCSTQTRPAASRMKSTRPQPAQPTAKNAASARLPLTPHSALRERVSASSAAALAAAAMGLL
jgi:flagellar basal body L-ring protein FlgH